MPVAFIRFRSHQSLELCDKKKTESPSPLFNLPPWEASFGMAGFRRRLVTCTWMPRIDERDYFGMKMVEVQCYEVDR